MTQEKKPISARFFISERLKSEAEARARKLGVSFSEYIRTAIEKDLSQPSGPLPTFETALRGVEEMLRALKARLQALEVEAETARRVAAEPPETVAKGAGETRA
jgi:hypothetical protein